MSFRNDYFGNRVDYFSIEEAHRELQVTSTSMIEVTKEQVPASTESPPWEEIVGLLRTVGDQATIAANQFTFDSTYSKRMDQLTEYASTSFAPNRPILTACIDLTRRIHEDYEYDPKATTVSAPVTEVIEKKAGVCQDFAHLQIACLRSIGLPARYVSGYLRTMPPPGKPRLVGADMSHAWVSVYCGSIGWIDFDPTNDCIPTSDHITLAWGRDYSDVCPIQGVFVGGGQNIMSVSVDVAPC